jgi:hypothetical protein
VGFRVDKNDTGVLPFIERYEVGDFSLRVIAHNRRKIALKGRNSNGTLQTLIDKLE